MGLYLVAYDIRDRNRWHKVHHMLIAQALPIQYSVFLFNGSQDAFERCMSALTSIIDPREDDLRFYELPKRGLKYRAGKPQLPTGIYFSGTPSEL